IPVHQLRQHPRLAELLRRLIPVWLAQHRAIGADLYRTPDTVLILALEQERQLADIGGDSIQTGIQGRVAGQVAALQLVVFPPRARVGFVDDSPAAPPVRHRLRRLARDVEPENTHVSPYAALAALLHRRGGGT